MAGTLTRKSKLGMGVKYLRLIIAKLRGRWPLRAPTKKRRDEAKMPPLRPPKVDNATDNGITQAKLRGKTRSPNVTATAFDDNISAGVSTVK